MQRNTSKGNKKQSNAVQNVSKGKATKTPQSSKVRKSRANYKCKEELKELIGNANLVKDLEPYTVESFFEDRESKIGVSIGNQFVLEFLKKLRSYPDELIHLLLLSKERIDYEKQDSYEYWFNYDDKALDFLTDLCIDGQITDDEFDELYDDSASNIAEILIEKGYYGEDYSYEKQQEKDDYENDDLGFEDRSDSTNAFWKIETYIQALNRLHETRNFLLSIIDVSNEYQKIKFEEKSLFTNFRLEKMNESSVNRIIDEKTRRTLLATSFSINNEGEIDFSISDWAKTVQGVDITRIRLCEVCNDIFWAKRKDSFACSSKHSKVRQMRLLRKNWKENGDLYLKARKKKAKKKKEKKESGSL